MKNILDVSFPFKDEDAVDLCVGLDDGAALRLPGKFKEAVTVFFAFHESWITENKTLGDIIGNGGLVCDESSAAVPLTKVTFVEIRKQNCERNT